MNTLIAITYVNESIAQQMRALLGRLRLEKFLELEDFVIAVNEGTKIRLNHAVNLPAGQSSEALFWTNLFGVLFSVPISSMATGTVTDAVPGHRSDYGIDENFAREVAREMKPGNAVLFLLIRQADPKQILDALKQYEGTILITTLSETSERLLRAALPAAPSA